MRSVLFGGSQVRNVTARTGFRETAFTSGRPPTVANVTPRVGRKPIVGGHLMSTQKQRPRAVAIIGTILSTGVIVVSATTPQPAAARVVSEALADHCHGPPSKAWCHDREDARPDRERAAVRRIPCGPPARQLRCTVPQKSETPLETPARERVRKPPLELGPSGRSPPRIYRR